MIRLTVAVVELAVAPTAEGADLLGLAAAAADTHDLRILPAS